MMNTVKRRKKRSRLRIKMNKYVGYTIAINFVLSVFAALYHIIYLLIWKSSLAAYIDYEAENFLLIFLTRIGNWLIILRQGNKCVYTTHD